MSPERSKTPSTPQMKAAPQPASRTSGDSKKSMNLDLKEFLPKLKKLSQKIISHLPFIVIMFVLAVYLFVVWQIRGLVTAEPSAEDESLALSSTNIPKIDKKAIEQIQSLEQNSPQVKTLFDEARNNPFLE